MVNARARGLRFERELQKFFEDEGAYVIRTVKHNPRTFMLEYSGFPDLVLIFRDENNMFGERVVFVEAKYSKPYISKDEKKEAKRLRPYGKVYVVSKSDKRNSKYVGRATSGRHRFFFGRPKSRSSI